MQHSDVQPSALEAPAVGQGVLPEEREVVSTHVLVPEEQVAKLRELSRKSRVAQSEYLREAVNDLLDKYRKDPTEVDG